MASVDFYLQHNGGNNMLGCLLLGVVGIGSFLETPHQCI